MMPDFLANHNGLNHKQQSTIVSLFITPMLLAVKLVTDGQKLNEYLLI